MARVKICGIMNQEDLELCANMGVHTLGFVVDYPIPVPWNLTAHNAKRLISAVPPFVNSCMVTGGNMEQIMYNAISIMPDYIQLHYKETIKETKKIAEDLLQHGIRTIKALRIAPNGNCDFEISDPIKAVQELVKTKISAILIDSYSEQLPGGTGIVSNLEVFKKIQRESPLPVILAGGITPENVNNIVSKTKPYAIDILSGVEKKPGIKDRQKLLKLMKSLHFPI